MIVEEDGTCLDDKNTRRRTIRYARLYLINVGQVRTKASTKTFFLFLVFISLSYFVYICEADHSKSEPYQGLELVLEIFKRVHKASISSRWVLKNKANLLARSNILLHELNASSLHLEYWKTFRNPLKFVPPQRSSTVNRSSLKLSSQEELHNHLATRILQKKIFLQLSVQISS